MVLEAAFTSGEDERNHTNGGRYGMVGSASKYLVPGEQNGLPNTCRNPTGVLVVLIRADGRPIPSRASTIQPRLAGFVRGENIEL